VAENAPMERVVPGIERLTVPLPMSPGHVHCYVVAGEGERFLVDCGLGLPDLEERLKAELKGPIDRILITHFHPDHVWGSGIARAATGAPVYQGRLDYEQCERVWGDARWPDRIASWFRGHGVPADIADEVLEQGRAASPLIRYARDPKPIEEGADVGGWTVLELPGHADGHLGYVRDGILLAGDHLLPGITPAVGLYPESRPDPLGAYLASLERTAELELRLALPGHGEPIRQPAERAREILRHHDERLEETAASLWATPKTAYEISLSLFGAGLGASQRRFAVAETLAHLERLVATGAAARFGDVTPVAYTALDPVGRRRDS